MAFGSYLTPATRMRQSLTERASLVPFEEMGPAINLRAVPLLIQQLIADKAIAMHFPVVDPIFERIAATAKKSKACQLAFRNCF